MRSPNLARMRALEEQVRAASDEQLVALLDTEDGQFLFAHCARAMASDVRRRLMLVIASPELPESTLKILMALRHALETTPTTTTETEEGNRHDER